MADTLTDLACKNAKPQAAEWKLRDSGGLYLAISPAGTKTWRWKYRIAGREKLLTIGRFPAITLREARRRRDRAREQLHDGIDPGAEKQRRKAAAALASIESLEALARAWHASKRKTWTDRYAGAVLARLEANVFPTLGRRPVREISSPEVLEAIRRIEKRGAHDMAHRVLNHLADVFVWAIAAGMADRDPAGTVRKALAPTDPVKRPAMVQLDLAREVLAKSEALPGAHWSTLLASRLCALTAARPGVVRLAEAAEFEGLDGAEPVWRIPAAKMKLTRARKRDVTNEFLVPLSRQAAELVRAAIATSPSPTHLFTGVGSWRKPISDSTLSKLYREAGFAGRHVPHGWRSSFSTIMNERAGLAGSESDRKIIDLMLAHVQPGVEWVYNRAAYLPRRRELAQEWADLLMAGLPPAGDLLPDKRRWRAPPALPEPGDERAGPGRHPRRS